MCSSSCATRDHKTFGECVRAKGIRVAYCQSAAGKDYTAQKQHDKRLASYADARRQGIQPETTNLGDVRRAVEASDSLGTAFKG